MAVAALGLASLGPAPATCLQASQQTSSPGAATQSQGTTRVVTPFEMVDRAIYVQGTLNGSRPLWFLLSSGSGISAINLGTAKELGIAAVPGTSKSGPVVAAIGGAAFPVPGMLVADLSAAVDQVGHDIDVVVGYDLLKHYVVDIDYFGNMLRLHDPAGYRPDPRATALPIRVSNNRAYLKAQVSLAGRARFVREYRLDTGVGGALVDEEVRLATSPKLEIVGVSQGSPLAITLIRTRAVTLGPFTFRGANGVTGDTAVGGELLRRFTTVIDYSRERLYLLPNRHYYDPFCFEMLGVELSTARPEGGLRVDAIYRNSTAAKAGLKVGDILTAIDGRPALEIPLGQVRMMFEQQNSYTLSIRSGAVTRTISVTLTPAL